MCFSIEADLVAGVALLPVAGLSLREVAGPRELAFASLPLVLAAHQLVEALVWAGVGDPASSSGGRVASVAAVVYILIALPLLPALVPWAVLALEPRGRRLRVAPFGVLGLAVAAYLLVTVLRNGVSVREEPHALVYGIGLEHGVVVSALYVVAVVGASLLSGYRSIVAFGLLNLVGLVTVALLYTEAFASLWCVYAALTSVLVLVHLYRRRVLLGPRRPHGTLAARS